MQRADHNVREKNRLDASHKSGARRQKLPVFALVNRDCMDGLAVFLLSFGKLLRLRFTSVYLVSGLMTICL